MQWTLFDPNVWSSGGSVTTSATRPRKRRMSCPNPCRYMWALIRWAHLHTSHIKKHVKFPTFRPSVFARVVQTIQGLTLDQPWIILWFWIYSYLLNIDFHFLMMFNSLSVTSLKSLFLFLSYLQLLLLSTLWFHCQSFIILLRLQLYRHSLRLDLGYSQH